MELFWGDGDHPERLGSGSPHRSASPDWSRPFPPDTPLETVVDWILNDLRERFPHIWAEATGGRRDRENPPGPDPASSQG